jgi:hypothetical protein
MPVESATSIRAASDEREAARVWRHEVAVAAALTSRDARVQEAKASAAARPTPAERAAEAPPPRASSGSRIFDVLA